MNPDQLVTATMTAEVWDTLFLVPQLNWTLSPGDGQKTVYYQFMDLAGLVSETYSASIMMDTQAPTGSIVIEDGEVYSLEPFVTLGLTSFDATSGVMGVRYSNDGVWDDEPWEDSSATKDWSGVPVDGVITVFYQVRDMAGWVSETYHDTIILDIDVPIGSIVINGGDDRTSSRAVSLSLTFEDGTSGVQLLKIWDDDKFDDEPYLVPIGIVLWTLLEGDGPKMVNYRIVDAVGRLSQMYSDTILLDTIAPSITEVSPNNGEENLPRDQSVVIRFDEPMDADSGTGLIMVTDGIYQIGGIPMWSENGTVLSYGFLDKLEPGTTYTVTIGNQATDLAGNKMVPVERTHFTTEGSKDDAASNSTSNELKTANAMFILAIILLVIALIIAWIGWKRGPRAISAPVETSEESMEEDAGDSPPSTTP